MKLLELNEAANSNANYKDVQNVFFELQKAHPKTNVTGRQIHEELKNNWPETYGEMASQQRSSLISRALKDIKDIWIAEGGNYFYVTQELMDEIDEDEDLSLEDVKADLQEAGYDQE